MLAARGDPQSQPRADQGGCRAVRARAAQTARVGGDSKRRSETTESTEFEGVQWGVPGLPGGHEDPGQTGAPDDQPPTQADRADAPRGEALEVDSGRARSRFGIARARRTTRSLPWVALGRSAWSSPDTWTPPTWSRVATTSRCCPHPWRGRSLSSSASASALSSHRSPCGHCGSPYSGTPRMQDAPGHRALRAALASLVGQSLA